MTIKPTSCLSEIFPITAMNELKNLQAESFTNNIIATASIEKTIKSLPQQMPSAPLGVSIPEIPIAISPIKLLGNYITKNWPAILVFTFIGASVGFMIGTQVKENKQKPKN